MSGASMLTMKELSKLPENVTCADCDSRDPSWTSINLGIFLCIKCAGIHRNLGVHHSKVRSIDLDTTCWDAEQIEFMRKIGNVNARNTYEYNAPCFYMRPNETDSPIVRENWIRAKYVRKEFLKQEGDEKDNPSVFMMPERAREGWLQKQNPKQLWQNRWFILHGRFLFYFVSATESYEKGRIDVSTVSIKVPDQPDATKRFTFEIYTQKKVYPLATETAEDMFSWIHAIRRASIYYSKLHKGVDDESKELPVDKNKPFKDMGKPIKTGELTKQGGQWKSWNKRWCVLAGGVLSYFKSEPGADDTPEGGVNLQYCDVVDAEQKTEKKHCFSIISPSRVYFFVAETQSELHEWINAIESEIQKLHRRVKVNFNELKL